MTWTQLHDRMALMAQLIQVAESDPEAALALADNSPEVFRLFGDVEGLLLSLRQRWMTTLVAKLDQAADDGVVAEQVRADLAAAEPGLRALLDVAAQRSLRLRSLSPDEQLAVDLLGIPTSDRQTVA
jgi:AcrR family transcriptional regulator